MKVIWAAGVIGGGARQRQGAVWDEACASRPDAPGSGPHESVSLPLPCGPRLLALQILDHTVHRIDTHTKHNGEEEKEMVVRSYAVEKRGDAQDEASAIGAVRSSGRARCARTSYPSRASPKALALSGRGGRDLARSGCCMCGFRGLGPSWWGAFWKHGVTVVPPLGSLSAVGGN